MRNMFSKQVAAVQGSPVQLNLLSTILCYVALIFGLFYFIIREKRSATDAFLLGLVIYAVFETTTLSLFKNWSYKTAVTDTLWGGTLFAVTTMIVQKAT